MTRTVTFLCSMLLLTACVARRTEEVDSNVRDPDGASGNDGGGKPGGDAEPDGNGTTDSGKPTFCDSDTPCDTPELPYCDEEAKACATCRNGSDCSGFAGRKACVKNEGCFECNGEKAGECGSAKPLCEPTKHVCVECTAEADEGCTLKGKVCNAAEGTCVECNDNAQCPDATKSKCDSDKNTCGKCTGNPDCAHVPGKSYCDTSSGACVACTSNDQCTDPAASKCDLNVQQCVGCGANPDCTHIEDGGDNLPLCVNAKCGECTRAEKAECGDDVCNALTNRCADGVAPKSASLCQACVSDEQCVDGQRCVQVSFESATGPQVEGWFCEWVPGAGGAPLTCSGARPFVSEKTLPSIDGMDSSTMCTHAVASCSAYQAFRDSCGRYETPAGAIYVDDFADPDLPDDVEGIPATGALIVSDSSVCGMAGKCVTLNATNGSYRCSHSCGNDTDCDTGFTCTGTPKLCK